MPINATITGRLARDPETRNTNKGTSITTMTVPVDTGWGDSKVTTWWRVTLFGKRGETAGRHLNKGDWATFSGPVSVREYTKKNGDKGWSAEMTANDFGFVGNKSHNSNSGQSRSSSSRSNQGGAPFAREPIPDIPF